jgi:hypothetical protein
MEPMQIVDLITERCIVTGEPAKHFSGHLTAVDPEGNPIRITAGFRDAETLDEAMVSAVAGCFGQWREEYGLRHEPLDLDDSFGLTNRVSVYDQHFSD